MSLLFAAASAAFGWKTFFFISRKIFLLVVFMFFKVYTLRIFLWYFYTHTHNFPPFIIKNISWSFLSHSFVLTFFFVSHFFIIMIFPPGLCLLFAYSENDFFCEQKSSFYRSVRSYNFIKCYILTTQSVTHIYCVGSMVMVLWMAEKKWKHSKSTQIFVLVYQTFLFIFFYFVCSRNNFYIYLV